MGLRFKQVKEDAELNKCVDLIRKSFSTVAYDFNLTIDNAPTNPAFIKLNDLINLREKGIVMFGIYDMEEQIGFVAIEKAKEKIFYMEKLAVLPEFRHKGYGGEINGSPYRYTGCGAPPAKKGSVSPVHRHREAKTLSAIYGLLPPCTPWQGRLEIYSVLV